MSRSSRDSRIHSLLTLLIACVWIFHGLYSKILNQIPRHRMIVARILGDSIAHPATIVIGLGEIGIGLWALSRRARKQCAMVQTLALVAMNTIEITLARDLLISAPGMVMLNVGFLMFVWWWATRLRP